VLYFSAVLFLSISNVLHLWHLEIQCAIKTKKVTNFYFIKMMNSVKSVDYCFHMLQFLLQTIKVQKVLRNGLTEGSCQIAKVETLLRK